MAWKLVESYNLGYEVPTKKFLFYYSLAGENVIHQIFPTAQEFMALADMFRNEGPISYSTTGNYFVTNPEKVGEEESHP